MFAQGATRYIPSGLATFLWEHAPGAGIKMLLANRNEVHKVAKQLVKDKHENEGGKDVLSLLGQFISPRTL